MRVRNIVAAGLLALSFGALAQAKPPTRWVNPLAAYVKKPDPSFGWTVAKRISGPGYHGAVLDLTSQTWLSPKETDRSVWKHWLTVIVPDETARTTGFLYITGGANTDPVPAKATERFVQLAVETRSVVVELDDVPNQPMHFPDSPDKARVEDDIIAHQEAKFSKDRNPQEILRLPMVKSGTAAMTAVQAPLCTTVASRDARRATGRRSRCGRSRHRRPGWSSCARDRAGCRPSRPRRTPSGPSRAPAACATPVSTRAG